jgi:hypothetical protein
MPLSPRGVDFVLVQELEWGTGAGVGVGDGAGLNRLRCWKLKWSNYGDVESSLRYCLFSTRRWSMRPHHIKVSPLGVFQPGSYTILLHKITGNVLFLPIHTFGKRRERWTMRTVSNDGNGKVKKRKQTNSRADARDATWHSERQRAYSRSRIVGALKQL